jgi:hypothetical protein
MCVCMCVRICVRMCVQAGTAKNHLHTLCLERKLAAVQSFLAGNPDALNKRDGDLRTPLHWVRAPWGWVLPVVCHVGGCCLFCAGADVCSWRLL